MGISDSFQPSIHNFIERTAGSLLTLWLLAEFRLKCHLDDVRDLYQFVQKVVEDRGWHSADPDHAKSTFQDGVFICRERESPNSQAMRHQ